MYATHTDKNNIKSQIWFIEIEKLGTKINYLPKKSVKGLRVNFKL